MLREMVSGPRAPAEEPGPGGGNQAARSPEAAAQAAESGGRDDEGGEARAGKMDRWLKRAAEAGGGGAASALQGEPADDKPGLGVGGAEASLRLGTGAPSEHEEE